MYDEIKITEDTKLNLEEVATISVKDEILINVKDILSMRKIKKI